MERHAPRIAFVVLLGVVVAAGVAFGGLSLASRQDSSKITQGQALYAEHCAACHGVRLEGQPNWQDALPNGRLPAPPHDASGHTWHHADSVIFKITKHGVGAVLPGYESDMPAFAETLSDDEIKAVLTFIRSSWPRREREYQDAQSKARP
jgi:mono/diheme cytochrome c family protein